MQKDIHPKYFPNAKATCACGAVFAVGSTEEKIDIEICSQCHPFYTGTDKVLDTAGRVEKFKSRAAAARSAPIKKQKKKKETKTTKRSSKTLASKKPAKK
ncbi:MAG: large subunit ribosomal protein L31 [Parcubacteria group bacterium Gr01-1014_48]|nr:MAG: large subunit ribosomal protein L31 [Parcubacteria group bacterium Greene0416_14]TSC74076.1 MAG: large subunit ribosomal protein L31 [Parcubacteria group bacterium Gr01-1014_48]TSD01137.1 MAG: large subunit ribosomal protein L31 [Parcubacteria group bacterium Greene1014_15]TSD08213.1 MAG: large subunit ribosomal protein L31 [Parcubacteria group bacterium Greene0714_4]